MIKKYKINYKYSSEAGGYPTHEQPTVSHAFSNYRRNTLAITPQHRMPSLTRQSPATGPAPSPYHNIEPTQFPRPAQSPAIRPVPSYAIRPAQSPVTGPAPAPAPAPSPSQNIEPTHEPSTERPSYGCNYYDDREKIFKYFPKEMKCICKYTLPNNNTRDFFNNQHDLIRDVFQIPIEISLFHMTFLELYINLDFIQKDKCNTWQRYSQNAIRDIIYKYISTSNNNILLNANLRNPYTVRYTPNRIFIIKNFTISNCYLELFKSIQNDIIKKLFGDVFFLETTERGYVNYNIYCDADNHKLFMINAAYDYDRLSTYYKYENIQMHITIATIMNDAQNQNIQKVFYDAYALPDTENYNFKQYILDLFKRDFDIPYFDSILLNQFMLEININPLIK